MNTINQLRTSQLIIAFVINLFIFLMIGSYQETFAAFFGGNQYISNSQSNYDQYINAPSCNACPSNPATCWNSSSVGSTNCGAACDGGNPWSKYNYLGCRIDPEDPRGEACIGLYNYNSAVCSTGDKCLAGETGLHAGSCTCGNYSQNITKYCCSASGQAEACTTSGAPQDNQPPNEGQCPGGYIVDGSRVRSSACTPIVVAPTTPTCSDGTRNGNEAGVDCGGSCPACPTTEPACGATCIYNEGETCKSGNCLDGSSNCSYNNNCGFVSGCSTGSTVTCPGVTTPPPPNEPPPGSCTISPSCTNGRCVFNINYAVDNATVSSFNTTLYPDLVQSSDPNAQLQAKSGTPTASFSSGQTVDWNYNIGNYQAGVRVVKTNGESATNCRTTTFSINDNTPPTCSNLTVNPTSGKQNQFPAISATTADNVGVSKVIFKLIQFNGTAIDTPINTVINTIPSASFNPSFNWNTTNAQPGTYRIAAIVQDTSNNSSNISTICTNTYTVDDTAWVSAKCTNNVFSGCHLEGQADCTNWGDPQTNLSAWQQCEAACSKPADQRNTYCTQPTGTINGPQSVNKTGTNWNPVNLSTTSNNTTNGTKVFIHSSTCTLGGTCNPSSGWTEIPSCATTTNVSKSCSYSPPADIQPGATRTFALFTSDRSKILATLNTRFEGVCTDGQERPMSCTNVARTDNVCTI